MDKHAPPFGPDHGFGVYFHWPYCTRICPYCDFNVYAAKDRQTDDLFNANLADLKGQARRLADHPPLTSIFIGGGTPSLMHPRQIEDLIKACQRAFGLTSDCEISLEANPNNVTQQSAKDWQSAGVSRLSIGLQSLNDEALTDLGRDHSSHDARRGVEIAASIFATYSVDLIYARPGQTLADWETELSSVIALGTPHLSLYELTIAPNTVFEKKVARGEMSPLPDTLQADMYELTDTLTTEAGFTTYEISNHARSQAHQSRHNQIYWQSGDWLGIGPGAHGRLTVNGQRIATEAEARPEKYIAATHASGVGLSLQQELSSPQTAQELLTMGLRPSDGIEISRIETLLGARLPNAILDHLQEGGWVTRADGRLALTPSGRLLADRIALELLK